MPEVSSFWVQHLFLSSFSGPGRTVRVHLDFLPVSPLLVFAVTLETSAQQFSPSLILTSDLELSSLWMVFSWLLKHKQEKVCPRWDGPSVVQSGVTAAGV